VRVARAGGDARDRRPALRHARGGLGGPCERRGRGADRLRRVDRDRLRRDARLGDRRRPPRRPAPGGAPRAGGAGLRMSALLDLGLAPLAAGDDPIEHIVAHPLPWDWKVGPVSITNHLFMLCVAALLMLLVFPVAARSK